MKTTRNQTTCIQNLSKCQQTGNHFCKITGLSRSFNEGLNTRPVLKAIDLDVYSGERLALLGKSGSGKSTVLNLIAGIDLADSGCIEMHGDNLVAMDDTQRTLFRRRHIGFIYQFFNLIPTLTVSENVALPLQLNDSPQKQAEESSRQMLQAVGLDDRCEDYPDQLSGGEQQRVAIARGLIHKPSLILADEPTGNLDAQSGMVVLNLLTSLAREMGQTVLIVTHSLQVAREADRVIALEDGKVIENPDDIAW